MSIYENIAIVISSIGLIISVISIYKSIISNNISKGQLEIHVHESIERAQHYLFQLAIDIEKNKSTIRKIIREKSYMELLENLMNVYEEACGLYLDNKVNKKRFKKNYYYEIKKLKEGERYKSFYCDENKHYESISKVYKKWFSNK